MSRGKRKTSPLNQPARAAKQNIPASPEKTGAGLSLYLKRARDEESLKVQADKFDKQLSDEFLTIVDLNLPAGTYEIDPLKCAAFGDPHKKSGDPYFQTGSLKVEYPRKGFLKNKERGPRFTFNFTNADVDVWDKENRKRKLVQAKEYQIVIDLEKYEVENKHKEDLYIISGKSSGRPRTLSDGNWGSKVVWDMTKKYWDIPWDCDPIYFKDHLNANGRCELGTLLASNAARVEHRLMFAGMRAAINIWLDLEQHKLAAKLAKAAKQKSATRREKSPLER